MGQIAHVLLTRSPLDIAISFDLHVLGMPPAFVLSQDQTLKFNLALNFLLTSLFIYLLRFYLLA